jgi:KipI family sensor histidine kinase inhibitor
MGIYDQPVMRLVGDRGVLVEYGDTIDPLINRKVRVMTLALREDPPRGILEVIPTYRSFLIWYDPLLTRPDELMAALSSLEARLSSIRIPPPRTVELPVCYGGEFGPDIGFVAATHGLAEEDVIRIHSEPEYLIYMIGFTPGFPFLGGLPEILATPRLKTPRTSVPAGTVGIAANQTGVYPVTSPGGWQLIGRTPLRLFDPVRKDPFLYSAGDLIRFKPISAAEYERLAGSQGGT